MGGGTGEVGWVGFAPTVAIGPGNPEAEKYGRMWTHPEYRVVSPGEQVAQLFLQQARPKPGSDVIDFGCGTGRGALALALFGGLRVTMIDFVKNCLDPEMEQALDTQQHALRFIKHDLEQKLPFVAEYGFCTDVMEHIPTEKVNTVLNNVLMASRHTFFQIATTDDSCGQLIGETLHLTVQPYEWWIERFRERECVIHWSQEVDGACLFYVTSWADGNDIAKAGLLNIGEDQIRANVKHNIAQGWNQISPHLTNDIDVMILGGGPSLADHLDEIRRLRAEGVKVITLNGSYQWALDHGLGPVNQFVVDARSFNARFTKPVDPGSNYFIASQCDPSVFEGLPKDRTFLWHTSTDMIEDLLTAQYTNQGVRWWPIPGGATVLTRAIHLLRTLGFKRFHLFGCDSCLSDTAHHAYPQPENDSDYVVPLMVTGGRVFQCHTWMITQAQDFINTIRFMGNEIEFEIHGDGLLREILVSGASIVETGPLA